MVVCLYFGLYSDAGTAWECGYAYGINKPVKLLIYREEEASLMVVQGAKNGDVFKNITQT